jgi:hypothetical protein
MPSSTCDDPVPCTDWQRLDAGPGPSLAQALLGHPKGRDPHLRWDVEREFRGAFVVANRTMYDGAVVNADPNYGPVQRVQH